MSKLVIPIAEVQGIDLKTNPLLLGTRKLRFATNLVFEEGVLKTRPGFVHTPLNLSGQFQGACSYRPAKGISSAAFADDCDRLALVVDGRAWEYRNCDSFSISPSAPFKLHGDVNLFQAENYLILQNPNTSTYWWDGTTFTESPGLIEQHWDDEEVPQVSLEDPAPVANIPECYPTSTYDLVVKVLDRQTGLPISGASVVLKRWSTPKYRGVTDVAGRCSWNAPMKKELRYFVSKNGYTPNNDVPFTVVGIDQEIIVLLDSPAATCGYTITDVTLDETEQIGTVSIENTGDTAIVINYLATVVDGAEVAGTWEVGGEEVTVPISIPVGETIELTFTADTVGALNGQKLSIFTNCGSSDVPPFEWGLDAPEPPPPPPPPPICNYEIEIPATVEGSPNPTPGAEDHEIYIMAIDMTNTGSVPISVTGATILAGSPMQDFRMFRADPINGFQLLPAVVGVGATVRFFVQAIPVVLATVAGLNFRLDNDCSPYDIVWPY